MCVCFTRFCLFFLDYKTALQPVLTNYTLAVFDYLGRVTPVTTDVVPKIKDYAHSHLFLLFSRFFIGNVYASFSP